SLYVRDPTLAETLLLAPPRPPFSPASAQNPLPQPLNIYTKALDESDWLLTTLSPSADQTLLTPTSPTTRPLSFLSAERGLGPQWRRSSAAGEERSSIVVGNGFGGFLAVPVVVEDGVSPRSSDSWKAGAGGGRLDGPGSPGLGGFWGRRGSAGAGTEKR